MKVIGLDLSLTGTGVCVLSNDGHDLTTIKSKPTGKSHKEELERIRGIVDEVAEAIDGVADLVAIEGLAFMARNTSALVQLSGLNYLIRNRLYDLGVGFVIIPPTMLKKFATGKGNAQKDHVMLEVYKKYGLTILDNNQADAFILAQIALSVVDSGRELKKYEKEVINSLCL